MTQPRCQFSDIRPSHDQRGGLARWVLRASLLPCAVAGLAFGCELGDSPPQEPLDQEYYEVERDTRRCASPRCGGYFVSALNRADTLCLDGSRAELCYVAEADFAALGDIMPPGRSVDLVRGTLEPLGPASGGFGKLVAKEGWSEVGEGDAPFTYFRLADNGIRCITTPCFSVDAELLNGGSESDFSNVDFSNAGLSDKQQVEATQALTAGNLLVNGIAIPDPGQSGIGTAIAVSQAYLPLSSATCVADADCGAGQWCRAQASVSRCVPFALEGEICEGFRLPEFFERCAPGLQCDLQDPTGDLGGVCRQTCKTNADCSNEQFCAEEGLCHSDGACEVLSDCRLPGNDYPVIACVGALTCSAIGDGGSGTQEGRCGIDCGAIPVAQ